MTPRKKIHGKFMPSIFQSPDPSPDPKIHDTHGGGSEAPPKAEGEPNPYFHSRAPRGPGASGPPWAPVALSTLLPQGRCFAYSDHGRAHVDHTFYKMDQLNESAQNSCCRGRRTSDTESLGRGRCLVPGIPSGTAKCFFFHKKPILPEKIGCHCTQIEPFQRLQPSLDL